MSESSGRQRMGAQRAQAQAEADGRQTGQCIHGAADAGGDGDGGRNFWSWLTRRRVAGGKTADCLCGGCCLAWWLMNPMGKSLSRSPPPHASIVIMHSQHCLLRAALWRKRKCAKASSIPIPNPHARRARSQSRRRCWNWNWGSNPLWWTYIIVLLLLLGGQLWLQLVLSFADQRSGGGLVGGLHATWWCWRWSCLRLAIDALLRLRLVL